jgi:hypothetical protein
MTQIYEIIFDLYNDEKIVIKSQIPLSEINYCTEASIILIQKSKQLLLAQDSFYSNVKRLNTLLKKVLKQELILHSTITKDIGYLFNQYSAIICGEKLKEPTFLTYIKKNNESYWIGNDYHLWAGDYITWLYNNSDGKVITFEVTPFYPYMYCQSEEEPNHLLYEEWIKTYQPCLIREISIQTAQEWLKQTEFILQKIDSNIQLWADAIE